jgi:hypothetical protein
MQLKFSIVFDIVPSCSHIITKATYALKLSKVIYNELPFIVRIIKVSKKAILD